MKDCIFCKIAKKQMPADVVYENDSVMAIKDMYPVAPVHILVIPKVHIDSLNDIDSSNLHVIGEIYMAIRKVVEIMGVFATGYRVITNCGKDGGQAIYHLHYHVIGGQGLGPKIF